MQDSTNEPTIEQHLEQLSDEGIEITRYKNLIPLFKWTVFLLTLSGILLSIIYVFRIDFDGRLLIIDAKYYYLLIAFFLPLVFLLLRARKKDQKLPWYDLIAAILLFAIPMYYAANSWNINLGLWKTPTGLRFWTAVILIVGALEASRRMGGKFFFILCVVVGAYPLFADYAPGVLHGFGADFTTNLGYMTFSPNGILGLTTKVFAEIIVAFLTFAGMLMASGGQSSFLI